VKLTHYFRLLTISLLALSLGACGIFGDEDDDILPPKELLKFNQTLAVKKVWSAKVGGDSEYLRLGLQPAGDGKRVYAAGNKGALSAYQPENGKRIWRIDTDADLSAGPAVGDDLVVVASADGELICVSATDGHVLWRIETASEILAQPVIHNGTVIVRTVDGKLKAFEAFDGSERWTVLQPVPDLSLRGTSAPAIVGNTVVGGFDNGRLIAADITDGGSLWEAMLSPPSGRSDLERLVDVDSYMVAAGQDVYAAGFQGQIAAVAVESGQALWSREHSTYNSLGLDWNNIYAVVDEGDLVALKRTNGVEVWRQDALQRRWPTGATAFDTAVAVGDFEGYVHFFSASDGKPVARVRAGKNPLTAAPVVIGNTLYIQSESGGLTAFRVDAKKKIRKKAPDTAGNDS
jgi:outer membrane protein assembly factor BamB